MCTFVTLHDTLKWCSSSLVYIRVFEKLFTVERSKRKIELFEIKRIKKKTCKALNVTMDLSA